MILVPMNNYVLIEETYKEEKTKSGCVKLEGNRLGEHMMLCTQEQIMGVIKNE